MPGRANHSAFSNVVDLINSRLGTDLKPIHKENPIKNCMMHTLADAGRMESLGFKPQVFAGGWNESDYDLN